MQKSLTLKVLLASIILSPLALIAHANTTQQNSIRAKVSPISAQCIKLFKETDQLVSEAKKQPGTHIQFKSITTQIAKSKQELLVLNINMQNKSCTQGLISLNRMKNNAVGLTSNF